MRRRERGLSLMEVMIAITLLSLLAVGMVFAMRIGLRAMETTGKRAVANRRAANAQRVLVAEVAGFLPVMAPCGARATGASGGERLPFFQGEPTMTRFVTTYSVLGSARGNPQIATLFVVQGEKGLRLVLNEMPFHGWLMAGYQCQPSPMGALFPAPEAGPGSFVVADQLAGVEFSYLMKPTGQPAVWVPKWMRKDLWPSAVRIEVLPLAGGTERVPPMTVTAVVRPNRFPGELYEY